MSRKRKKRVENKQGTGSARLKPPPKKDEILPEQQPPIFSLEHLQSTYCITACNSNDQAQFALKLKELSQLTWSHIQSLPRHGLGYEKIRQDAIRHSIPSHITSDVNLLAFRFSGTKPMVGYRSGRIFYVVWLDKDYTLYDHGS